MLGLFLELKFNILYVIYFENKIQSKHNINKLDRFSKIYIFLFTLSWKIS